MSETRVATAEERANRTYTDEERTAVFADLGRTLCNAIVTSAMAGHARVETTVTQYGNMADDGGPQHFLRQLFEIPPAEMVAQWDFLRAHRRWHVSQAAEVHDNG